MLLEIIVPHYNEPWSVVRPFFEMLRCQRCADFDSFTVHIVHDGTEAFPESNFSEMPFKVRQSVIQHGGVSAARNYGLEHSEAEWICFCDCDDTFVSIYALHEVMNVLPAEGYDLLWCRMIAEDYVGEENKGEGARPSPLCLIMFRGAASMRTRAPSCRTGQTRRRRKDSQTAGTICWGT